MKKMIGKLLFKAAEVLMPILLSYIAKKIEEWLDGGDEKEKQKAIELAEGAQRKALNAIKDINRKIVENRKSEIMPGAKKNTSSHDHHIGP